MHIFLTFLFVFFIGCVSGWILEVFYRRVASGHWVNPGFMIGPYLPIYGFGVSALTIIYLLFKDLNVHPLWIILLMGATMTFIEFIGGLSFIDGKGVKLWDYSKEWGNYKGIICPKFSFIWTCIAALYYYVLATPIMNAILWFRDNLAFSFVLGVLFGVMVIDYIYSTKLYLKIRKYAKENDISIRLEELKENIKETFKENQKKHFFLLPLLSDKKLKEYLEEYKSKSKLRKFKLFGRREKI